MPRVDRTRLGVPLLSHVGLDNFTFVLHEKYAEYLLKVVTSVRYHYKKNQKEIELKVGGSRHKRKVNISFSL